MTKKLEIKSAKCPFCEEQIHNRFRPALAQHFRRQHPELVSVGRRLFGELPVADWDVPRLMVAYIDGIEQDVVDQREIKSDPRPTLLMEFDPAAGWQAKLDSVMPAGQVVPTPDLVNHPPHYTFGKYEVIDVLQDWFADDPLLWQVVKYLARARHKGNELQDLRKAEFYLQRRIAALAGQEAQ